MLEAIERAMAASCGGGRETWLMTCGCFVVERERDRKWRGGKRFFFFFGMSGL